MKSAFRKISRVGSLTGGTKWYLSSDCLLAAKITMYVVEYRRFYLRDLESISIWPRRSWLFRVIIPGTLLGILGAGLWKWTDPTAGAIFAGCAVAWVVWELLLGPTAGSCIRATGISVTMPLVKRTRRADKVLAAIDAAARASRDMSAQPTVFSPQPSSASPSATRPVADASPTIGI